MSPEVILKALFGVLPLVGGLTLIAIIGSMLFGAMLINGKRIPAALAVAGPAVVLSFILFLSAAATNQPGDGLQDMGRFATPISLRMLAPVFLFLPSLILGICVAVAGLRAPSRDWRRGAVPAGIVALITSVVLFAGVIQEDLFFTAIRCAMYVLVAVLMVFAFSGEPGEGDVGSIGSTAAMTGALFIGAVELAAVAMKEFFVLMPLAGLCPAKRGLYIDSAFSQHISAYSAYTALTLLLAVGCGLYGVYFAYKKGGGFAALTGIVWVGLVGSILVVGKPTQAEMKHLASTIEAPEIGRSGQACE